MAVRPMDVDRYLERIGLESRPCADASGLVTLQQAHRRAIPFENLDIMLGRAIRIDSESVFDKLVARGRGGYCFEQNRLYSDMLAALGFANRPLLARVRLFLPDGYVPPRTHVLLLVETEAGPWIADAGFGGSYIPPLPMRDGAQARTADGVRHRLRRQDAGGSLDGDWLLERAGSAAATDGRAAPHPDWQPQYSFDLAEVAPEDLEMGNHWTSTRPDTRFTSLHIASLALPHGFASLNQRTLTVFDAGKTSVREIADQEDYRQVLHERFGIGLSAAEISSLALFADA